MGKLQTSADAARASREVPLSISGDGSSNSPFTANGWLMSRYMNERIIWTKKEVVCAWSIIPGGSEEALERAEKRQRTRFLKTINKDEDRFRQAASKLRQAEPFTKLSDIMNLAELPPGCERGLPCH